MKLFPFLATLIFLTPLFAAANGQLEVLRGCDPFANIPKIKAADEKLVKFIKADDEANAAADKYKASCEAYARQTQQTQNYTSPLYAEGKDAGEKGIKERETGQEADKALNELYRLVSKLDNDRCENEIANQHTKLLNRMTKLRNKKPAMDKCISNAPGVK